MANATCQKCNARFPIVAGQQIVCPGCGQKFKTPARKSEPLDALAYGDAEPPSITSESMPEPSTQPEAPIEPPLPNPSPAATTLQAFSVPASAFNPDSPIANPWPDWSFISPSAVIGGILIFASIVVLTNNFEPFFPSSTYFNRFKSDNAMGATANATEFLAEHHVSVRAGELLIAGLLVILIGRVGSAVRRLDGIARDCRQMQPPAR